MNGRTTASNLWTVDGAANQDTDGGGTGPQARITLDSMAEFQVLTHQYTAEFGGSSGVIVNAVTKSGANLFSGRGFYYFEDESLRARDAFLDPSEEKPEAGRKTFGFNIGGPIVRNKAFFFVNVERNLIENAVVHTMPPEAAPLATSYADATFIKALSTFARVDYTARPEQLLLPLAARGIAGGGRRLRMLPDARQSPDRAGLQRSDVQHRLDDAAQQSRHQRAEVLTRR